MTGWSSCVAAAVAGGIGAGLRYLVDVRGHAAAGARRFPSASSIVNVTGSFALGVLAGLGAAIVRRRIALVIGVGLLGGYTTFSTVSVEIGPAHAERARRRRGWIERSSAPSALALAAGAARRARRRPRLAPASRRVMPAADSRPICGSRMGY